MQISNWLWSWLEMRQHRRAPQSPLDYAARLTLRKLEERQVLNVTAVFDATAGALTVTADANDHVTVSVDTTTHEVTVNGNTVTIEDSVTHSATSVLASDIHTLDVTATGNFDNVIDFNGLTAADGTWDITIDGGDGTDQIDVNSNIALTGTDSIFLSAETINIGASVISTDQGSMTFDGAVHLSSATLSGDIHLGGDLFVDSGLNSLSGQLTDTSDIFLVGGAELTVTGLSSGTLELGSTQTLSGSGTLHGNLTGTGTVSPGSSPGILTIDGDFEFDGTIDFEVDGTAQTLGVDYDQIVVTGNLDITGATLVFAGSSASVPANQLVTLILNDGPSTTAEAASHTQGQSIDINGTAYKIFYSGGDGNDVVLVEATIPDIVYVEDIDWSLYSEGMLITDADGAGHSAIYGVTAFNSIQTAVDNVAAGGTVEINAGTYAEAVVVDKSLTLDGLTGVAAEVEISGSGSDGISITSGATDVTVSDLTVSNSQNGISAFDVAGMLTLTFNNVVATGNTADGFHLQSIGSVQFVDVTSQNNFGNGIWIESVTGLVDVNGAMLTNNLGDGFNLTLAGSATLTNVEAYSNQGSGLTIATILGDLSLDSVTSGTVTPGQGNSLDGVSITEVYGTLTLTDVEADGNTEYGISLVQVGITSLIATVDGGGAQGNGQDGLHVFLIDSLTVTNGTYSSNLNDGLSINNVATLELNSVTAESNVQYGLDIADTDSVNVDDGSYSFNEQLGIFVFTAGEVVLTNVNASDNLAGGAWVLDGGTSIIVSGGNYDRNLATHGLLLAADVISITGATANDNEGYGIAIIGADTATIQDTEASGNGEGGVIVTSVGTVEIDNVTATNNDFGGLLVSEADSVTISVGTFSDNTNGVGISIDGVSGAVTLTDVTVTGNSGGGLSVLVNTAIAVPVAADTVLVDGGTYSNNGGVGIQLDGVTTSVEIDLAGIQNNAGYGIEISNTGLLTLSDIAMLGNVGGGSITDVTMVTLNTTTGADTVDINTATIGGEGHLQQTSNSTAQDILSYTGVDTLNVNTLDGTDTVHVAAHSTTAINLDGGADTDTVSIETPNPTLTVDGSGFTVATTGNALISVQNFENANLSGAVVFSGSTGDDTLTLAASDVDAATYTLVTDGNLIVSGSIASVTSVEFDAGDGDDLFVIENQVGGLFNPVNGIVFDGGTGGEGTLGFNPDGDALQIIGGSATTVEHQVGNANSDGSVLYNGSASITYSDVASILDTVTATNRTFTFLGGTEDITVSDSGTSGETTISSTVGGQITFSNPTTLLSINSGTGDDTITLDGVGSGYVASLNIDGGAGTDVVDFNTNLVLGSLAQTGSIAVQAETINVDNGASLSANGGTSNGTITLTASDEIVLNGTGSLTAGDVALVANRINLDAASTIGGTTVEIHQFTNGRAIDLGSTFDPNGGPLSLSDIELGRITADTLTIGEVNSGSITVSDSIAPAGVTTLHLITGSAVIDANVAGPDLTVTNLAIEAVAGIGDGNALDTIVSHLAFHNTTSGDIAISNTGSLTIDAVAGVMTSSNDVAVGTTTLNAASPITFAVNVTSGGTITATTADNGAANADNITVNTGVTVESTGGDVIFQAGDHIIVNATATVKADVGSITLVSGFGDTDNDGGQQLDGSVQAGTTVTIDLSNAPGSATQAATGAIVAANLELLSANGGGSFNLTSASNNVVTLAGNVDGAVQYRDADGVDVGVVSSSGLTTTDDSVTIMAGGAVGINESISAGAGTVRIAAGGNITEATGATITAASLGVRTTSGSIVLTEANDVATFAANDSVSGQAVKFRDLNAFDVGSVSGTTLFTATTGVATTNGDVTLKAGGALGINESIDAGSGTVRIAAGGSVTEAVGKIITADSLGVTTTSGNVVLTESNQINTLTVNNSGAAGVVKVATSSGVTIGSVAVDADPLLFGATSGITTSNGDFTLAAAGAIQISQAVAAGSGTVRLQTTTGGVGQSATGTIMADNLGVRNASAGNITLDQGNNVTTFAASNTAANASITYKDTNAVIIGSVTADGTLFTATNGISTSTGDVTVSAAGDVTLNQSIAATGATVRISAAGDVTEAAAATITAASLGVRTSAGDVVLTEANDVATFAANDATAGKVVKFRDANGFNVGSVSGTTLFTATTGVATSNGDITLKAGGALGVNESINAGGGTVRIAAGGSVTEAVGKTITASSLGVTTSVGNITLDQNNTVGTFAASDTSAGGAVTLVDTTGVSIGSVAADGSLFALTDGMSTSAGDVTVSAAGAVTLNQSIAATGATVRISAAGDVTEAAAAIITATSLAVRTTTGDVVLTQANDVATFAASNTAAGKVVKFHDANAFNVGAVTSNAYVATTTGVTASGDITFKAGGTLGINESIDAGSATVRITAGGSVTEAAGKTITADSLGVTTTAGNVVLTELNQINTLAVNDSGAAGVVKIATAGGVTIGSVSVDAALFPATSGITTSNGDFTLAAAGAILVNQAVAVGSGTVRLQTTTGGVSQSAAGTITADKLGVRNASTGNITLDQGNNVATIAANNTAANGTITYHDTNAVAIGSVTADGTLFTATNGMATSAGDVTITAAGTVTLDQSIAAAGATVRISAAGSITETAGATITAASLGVRTTTGDILLTEANDVTTFAASNAGATNVVRYQDANAFNVGVVGSNPYVATTTGVTTANGDVTLKAGGALGINESINAGSATVRIAAGGNVVEAAGKTITANVLGVTTSAGNITLDQNNTVGTFAASDTAVGGAITFVDTTGVSIGSVTADGSLFSLTNGINTSAGDVTVSAAGAVTLNQSIAAAGATIRISAAGAVTEAAAATITAASLGVRTTSGNIVLTEANDVTTFAANDTAAGQAVKFRDANAFNVGSVIGTTLFTATAGVATANADVTLKAGGALGINESINAGSGTVRVAAAGSVTEAAGKIITADTLGVTTTAGNVVLTELNQINTLAVNDSGVAGIVKVVTSGGVTIGSVAADADPSLFGATSGITTSNGDFTLASAGAIQINQAVNVGTGTVRLQTSTGGIAQSATGTITADKLGVRNASTGNITLDQNNTVGTFAASDTSAGGVITFIDTTGVSIGSVTADGSLFSLTNGISTSTGDVTVSAGGAVTLNQSIAATGATVRISAAGDVTEAAAATITATALGVRTTTGDIVLTQANDVTTFAASNTAAAKVVKFVDANAFNVGVVTTNAYVATTTGVTTSNGDITLKAGGTLGVNESINAGNGIVRIAAAGSVTEAAGKTITASSLGVTTSVGNITLDQNNTVGTFAASDTSAGGTVTFVDTTGVSIGTVTADGSLFALTNGISTSAGDVTVSAAGTVTLNQSIAATGATVRILAAGDVTEAAAATITATALGVRTTTGDILLTQANDVTTFAASNIAAGKVVKFQDANGFNVGAVGSNAYVVTTTGISTANGDVTLKAGGVLGINESINAGSATVRIAAGGSVTEAAGKTITANSLGVTTSVGNITLDQNNVVGTFAASDTSAGGAVTFVDTTGVSIGSVAADGSLFALTSGISTSVGDVTVSATGAVTLNQSIAAAGATVRISAAGSVTEAAAATITAASLGVRTTSGNIVLTEANDVATFAANDVAAGQAVKFRDANAFNVGAVSGNTFFTATTGVATSNGDVTLKAGSSLGINESINAGSGTVRISAGGSVTEASGKTITANSLGVTTSAGNVVLAESNQINTLAVNDSGAAGVVKVATASGVTIGSVAVDTDPSLFGATSGITTSNGDFTLAAGGLIQINQAVNVGSATVRLNTTTGGVAQAAAGTITADKLGVRNASTGNIILDQNNTVGTFAASNTANSGTVTFVDSMGVIVGSVSADGSLFSVTNGISTSTGDVTVSAAGSVTLNQSIAVSGATVRISAAGDVTEASLVTVTAASLGVRTTTGDIVLTQANDVSTFAASNSAVGKVVKFQDANAVNIGSVSSNTFFSATTGIATANGDVTLKAGGVVGINEAITAGSGTVRIAAGGSVTESAGKTITANSVGITTTVGNITLDQNNTVGTFAASDSSSGGVITFVDTTGVTIGSVTADGSLFALTNGISTSAGDVTVSAAGAVTLNQSIAAAGATVRISAAGDVTEAAAAIVTGTALSVRTTAGDILLTQANDVTTFAASNIAAGKVVKFQDANLFNVGAVGSNAYVAATTGVVTSNGDVTLKAGGAIGINESINAGSAVVRIAAGGSMTEASGKTVTANSLGVTTSTGNITLDQNNTVGTFAASNASVGGSVALVDTTGVSVGSVTADGSLFALTNGISTSTGDVTLSASGAVTLNQSIAAAGATVRISAAGSITEAAAATITAAALGTRTTSGNIVLTEANDVTTFAANDAAAGQAVKFRDANGFNVGSVSGTTLFTATTGVATSNGDVTLKAGTTLGINESINAGTATVRIAAGGSVTEGTGKTITADTLGVTTSAGNVVLAESNQINTLAVNDSGAAGVVRVITAGGVTIGSITADANPSLFGTTSGVTTTNGDFTLNAAGAIQINQAVSAGTGTVRLQTTTGGISQSATGTITADKLGVRNASAGNITLDQNNNVATFAASNTAANASITYNDADAITVGSVIADGTLFTATNGIATNVGNVNLTSGGLLTIGDGTGQDLTAAGATVTLTTSAGGITEAAGSIISANNLLLLGTGNDSLTQANLVSTLAANVDGSITYVDADALTIGSVGAANGITTTNDNVSVKTSTGDLTLAQAITAGTGTVTLEATTGSLVDGNDGSTMITAGDLSLSAKTNIGDITNWSTGTGNAIDATISGSLTKAAITDANGEIFIKFTGNATIGTGALSLAPGAAASAMIVATGNLDARNINTATALSAGDQLALEANGILTLPDAGLNVGDTGNLRLHGTSDVVDASGRTLGELRAANLDFASGSTGGNTVLNTRVATVNAAITGASASGKSLTINEFDGLALTSVVTTDGAIIVNASQGVAGDITVLNVNAGTTRVTLNTTANGGGQIIDGDAVDNPTTANITAAEIDLRAATGVANGNKLEVATNSLAATTVSGEINVRDVSGTLTIANLASGTNGVSITGGTAGNKIDISTVGALTVNANVTNAGTGNRSILLSSDGSAGTNDLSINANVTTTGGNSAITLLAGDTASFTATSTVSAAGTGSVQVFAGTAYNNGAGNSVGTLTGNISMSDGSVIQSDDGNITLSAPNDVAVSIVNANANGDGIRGNIVITADADLSGVGAISESLTGEAANLTGSSATLMAATGIGASNDIDTNLDSVSAINSTSGAIAIQETAASGALVLTTATNVGASISVATIDGQLTSAGVVTTTGGGAITLFAGDSAANNGGNLVLQGAITAQSGQVTLTSERNDVTFTAGADVATTTGTIQVNAGTTTGGKIVMTDDNVNVTILNAGSGLIDLNAGGDVTLGKLVTSSSSNVAVQIHSTSGAVIDADTNAAVDIDAANGRLVIVAATGIGSSNAIEASLASIDITNTTSGNVALVETDALSIQRINQQGAGTVNVTTNGALTVATGGSGISATAGKVTLLATGVSGSVDVDAAISTTSGDVDITADGLLTVNQPISTGLGSGGAVHVTNAMVNATLTAGQGDITLNGGGQDVIITADQSKAVTITYSATRDIIIRATVTTTGSTSDIILTADSDGNGVGGVWIDESAATNAKIDAGRDVILKGSDVFATAGSNDSIRIDSDGAVNQIIAGRNINLTANTAAPAGADIVIDGVESATAGSITVDSKDAILISANQNAGTDLLYQDAVQLTADITLTAAQNVTFTQTLDGAHNLQITAGGITAFEGAIGATNALTSLTTDAPGTTDLNGGVINVTTLDLQDDVILTANTTINATTVAFEKTINADVAANDRTLLVNATTTTFNGAIGTTNVLASLTTDAAGTTHLNAGTIDAKVVDFQDAVILESTTIVNATTVSFDSTVDAATAGLQGLTVNASGTTTFGDGVGDDKVGGAKSLAFLTTDAIGSTILKSTSVTTSGDQTYHDAVVLASNSVTANTTLTGVNVSFDSTLDGTLAGTQGLTVNASGVTTFGDGTGDDKVGGATTLAFLTTDAAGSTVLKSTSVSTSGDQTYHDIVVLASNNITANTTLNGVNVSFDNTVDGTTAGTQGLTVNASGTTTFGDGTGDDKVGGATSLAFLTTDAPGSTLLKTTSITTSGNQSYHDAVVLASNSVTANSILIGVNVSFDSTLDGTVAATQGLTINASGQTTFGDGVNDDKVGGATSLAFLTTDAAGSTVLKSTSVTTSGDQTYHDAVVLASNSVTANTTLNGVNISFDSTVDGTAAGVQGLTVNASGTTTFGDGSGDDKVGGATSLAFLTTDAAGSTLLKSTSVTTSGDQTYHDAVVLASNSVTVNTMLNGVNVSFDSTVDGTTSGTQGLTINASGVTTFGDGTGDDKVGTTSLAFLTTDAAGSTVLKSTSVTTSGDQTYHDAVVLASNSVTANTTLTGVNVSFDSTLDGTTAGTQGLTINASAVTTFGDGTGDDKVGGVTSLAFLTTDAAGSTALKSTSVTTSGDQTYHDAVVLASNSVTANTTLNGANISFDSTLDGTAAGTQGLTVNASGTTTFGDGTSDDKVGGTTSLAFLTTDAAGSTILKTTSVTTSGNQTYHDAVVLVSNNVTAKTTLTGVDVTFDSTLNGTTAGTQGLTVNATGDVLFTGAVGGLVQLGDTLIVNAHNVTETSGLNATSLVQQAGTGTTTLNGNVATTNSTGVQLTTAAITVNAPITTTGSGVVTFTNAGLLTINGNISADGAITQNGAGLITITEPRTLSTTGDIVSFATNVTLNGSGSLLMIDTTTGGNSAGANVSFLGTVHGATSGVNAESLTINAGTGGAIRFAGQVDSLHTLTITNSDTTTFQSTLQADTVLITDTTDTVAFQGNTNLATLTTTNQPYNITFGKVGGPVVTDVITNPVNFLSTGLVTIGLNAGDNVTFTSGVTHTVSATNITGTLTSITGAVQFGTTSLDGTIRTQAQQVTLQATTLTGTSLINTTFGNAIGADITFGSTLNATAVGVQDLTLNSGTSGNILLTGAAGGGTRLGDLTITNAHNLTEQAGITATSLVQSTGNGTTTLNGAVNTNSSVGVALTTNAITINNNIATTGTGGVTLTNAGLLTLNGNIASDGAVTQNGAGAVSVTLPIAGTRSITTTGDAVSFLRATTLNGSAGTLSINTTTGGNAAGGNVTFSSTIGATNAAPNAENLQVTAGTLGDVLLGGSVGGITRLGNVVIASAHNVTENGGIRSATLTQSTGTGLTTLNGAVDTNASAGVQLTTGAITVNNIVSATNQIAMTALNTNGNINLNSTLLTTQPAGTVSLTATHGGIVNGAAANVANVITGSLVMQTTQGIGSVGNSLLTQVATIAAHNTGSGNIRVDNIGGQLLTIGTIGGVSGIVNDGVAIGNIVVTNTGSIEVSSFSSPTNGPVTNSTGGSITLMTKGGAFDITVNSPITASGGSGNITLSSGHNVVVNNTGVTNDISAAGNGTVYLTAAASVVLGSQNPNTTPDATQHTVPNDVVIQSGTGSITNTLPLVYNIQAPQLGADGILTVSGDFGRPGEHNFTVTIYWGDGTSSTQVFANSGHFSFSHTYTHNPNQGDQSAPILINVQVAHDPHVVLTAPNVNTATQSVPDAAVPSPPPVPTPNINADLSSAIYNSQDPNYASLHGANTKIVLATGNASNPGTVVFQDISILATAVPVPGEGLSTFPFDVTPPVAYLHFPEQTATIDVLGLAPLQLAQQDTLRLEMISADEGIAADRQVILEIIRADGSIERIRLDENVLDDLMKTVSDLPDGRYRFLLLEPGESRLRTLLDLFEVRQGKIVDENDTGDRPPSSGTRPVKPTTGEAPADAEEAIRNAHAPMAATLGRPLHPESEVQIDSQVISETSLMNGWKSMSARRAWKQAERLTEEVFEQSQHQNSAAAGEANPLESAAADDGQSTHASAGAAVVMGTAVAGLAGLRTGNRIIEEATARFGRAARLFRKLGSKPK
ncbi:MAG: hypothetical protein JWP89_69 [Schlesneria sp.]|nr:hypothetical protein [Schlesneria sp.]